MDVNKPATPAWHDLRMSSFSSSDVTQTRHNHHMITRHATLHINVLTCVLSIKDICTFAKARI